ncbi:MAG: hypothetical protein ACLPGW_17345 [Roseiarcus sp.]
MARSLNMWVAAALALALAAPVAQAQTSVRPLRHHVVHPVVHAGDIIVHARPRTYLDPGPPSWSEAGTGDRYVSDSAPGSPSDFGTSFANRGFDLLPSRFNPPGRPEPLFMFSEP